MKITAKSKKSRMFLFSLTSKPCFVPECIEQLMKTEIIKFFYRQPKATATPALEASLFSDNAGVHLTFKI